MRVHLYSIWANGFGEDTYSTGEESCFSLIKSANFHFEIGSLEGNHKTSRKMRSNNNNNDSDVPIILDAPSLTIGGQQLQQQDLLLT